MHTQEKKNLLNSILNKSCTHNTTPTPNATERAGLRQSRVHENLGERLHLSCVLRVYTGHIRSKSCKTTCRPLHSIFFSIFTAGFQLARSVV